MRVGFAILAAVVATCSAVSLYMAREHAADIIDLKLRLQEARSDRDSLFAVVRDLAQKSDVANLQRRLDSLEAKWAQAAESRSETTRGFSALSSSVGADRPDKGEEAIDKLYGNALSYSDFSDEEIARMLIKPTDVLMQFASGKVGMFRGLSGSSTVAIPAEEREAAYEALLSLEQKEALIDAFLRSTQPERMSLDEYKKFLKSHPGVAHMPRMNEKGEMEVWQYPQPLREQLKALDSEMEVVTQGMTVPMHVTGALLPN